MWRTGRLERPWSGVDDDRHDLTASRLDTSFRRPHRLLMSNSEDLRATMHPRSSEEPFRLLVESIVDYAIFMLDANGIVTTWNLGAERIKGYRAEEIIGQHVSRFYLEEDVRAGVCDRELGQAAEAGRFQCEGRRVRKDGSLFWADVVITAVRDPANGGLLGFGKVTGRPDATKAGRRGAARVRGAVSARRSMTRPSGWPWCLSTATSSE